MTAVVNTLLARCMVDPDFLADLASDSERALRGYDLDARTAADFAALDLRRLVGLASIITKVQSNGLWQWFPCTRALTVKYGIEHELFAAFSREHQDLRSHPKTRDGQTARFTAFVRTALDEWIPLDLPALRDVFMHESLFWEIRTAMIAPLVSTEARPGAARPNGVVHIAFFESHAEESVAAIRTERFRPEAVQAVPHWMIYQGDPETQTIRTAEIGEDAARVLAFVDGRTSCAAIARSTGYARAAVNDIVTAAADAGLVITAQTRGTTNAPGLRR